MGLDLSRVWVVFNTNAFDKFFGEYRPEIVIHLGARAGVRDSFGKEVAYHKDNIDATQNLIECCKMYHVGKVIYASTSSVYGGTPIGPKGWTEDTLSGHQRNAYAYTKYVNEIQWGISGINNIGLRFFTVYGPWGRPDMALFNFTRDIIEGNEIHAFNYGNMKRDFTYIDDIVESLIRVVKKKPLKNQSFDRKNSDPSTSWAPFKIFNIGNSSPVKLMTFIEEIENALNKKAEKIFEEKGYTWQAVVETFVEKELTEEDALVNARLARILQTSDYDHKNKEPILWTPPSDYEIRTKQDS